MVDISTSIGGIRLGNPTILASGFMGVTGASMAYAARSGAGAVTMKSLGLEPRKVHPCPVVLSFDKGLINAVGLSGSGIEESMAEIEFAKKHAGVPVIASIFAGTKKEFGMTAKEVSKAKPDLIEVNISCPNVHSEFGRPFGTDPKTAAEVTREVKKNTKVPVIVKLTPNVVDIKEIAVAVAKAGADVINAINTLGPGMIINITAKKPVLFNKRGGLSGPAVRPIAVRCIYDIYEATKGKIPLIGTGGVTYGNDAVEMFMAGASAVGIGSAIHYRDIGVFRKVSLEITNFMKANRYSSIKEMVGVAHEN
ncbi:MAG: dihydroorotate dehydrogenase [Nanoarchaeota archaeon]|nr:dihydroorotate dehydrogenase [Nanoarchaeota archaeon]